MPPWDHSELFQELIEKSKPDCVCLPSSGKYCESWDSDKKIFWGLTRDYQAIIFQEMDAYYCRIIIFETFSVENSVSLTLVKTLKI